MIRFHVFKSHADATGWRFVHATREQIAATLLAVPVATVQHAVTCWCQIDTLGGQVGVVRHEAEYRQRETALEARAG